MDYRISGVSSENFSFHSEGGRPKLERRCSKKSKHYSEKLLDSGALPLVVCQHCSSLLAVPTNLPPPRKSKQKLRCGACMRISTFSVPQRTVELTRAVDNYRLDTVWFKDRQPNVFEDIKSDEGINNNADDSLLKIALGKLDSEFRRLLLQNSAPLKLPERMPMVESSVLRTDDGGGEALEVESMPTLPPVLPFAVTDMLQTIVGKALEVESMPTLFPVLPFAVTDNLLDIYRECRLVPIKQSLEDLGASAYLCHSSPDKIDLLSWMEVEGMIALWSHHVEVTCRILLKSERRLCTRVFSKVDKDKWIGCWGKLGTAGFLPFLAFGEAVAQSRIAPEKLFKLLDMYDVIEKCQSSILEMFEGADAACEEIQVRTRELQKKVVFRASETLSRFIWMLEKEPSDVPRYGERSPLSSYVMNYASYIASEYAPLLTKVLRIHKRMEAGIESQDDLLATSVQQMIGSLERHLVEQSKTYTDPSLGHIFMMNCYFYMLSHVIREDSKLLPLLGRQWCKDMLGRLRQSALHYQRETWGKMLAYLTRDGLQSSSGSSAAIREIARQKIRSFTQAFDDTCQKHANWTIPSENLRGALELAVKQMLMPAYRSYTESFRNLLEQGRTKHMKYTAEEIEQILENLFQLRAQDSRPRNGTIGEPLLAGLNRSTSTAPDSGDVQQSPRYMTSLEGQEKIPEQPPSSIRGTEAGSTRIQQTKGKNSQCEEEGDTTEAVRDEKSRAQPTNLTASGEIKDMTPPTKREDLTMDFLGKSDEVSNAQAESMPVNLMDWKSLRPDVLALGFKSFHHEFNPERILCIYSVSQGAVEILFSHAEGMAMLFGVGLSFSSVLLRKDGVKDGIVEVKELQQPVWMNHWSISEMSNFSPLLFSSSTSSIQPSGFDQEPRSTVLSFSPEQAAEWFGVGLEGSPSYFTMMPQGEFQHEVSNVTAVSPSWIASLYDFLSYKGHAGNDVQAKVMGSEHNHGSSLTTTYLSSPSSSGSTPGTSLHENNHWSQGQELPEVTAIECGMQSQPRQLTVIIRLDPENCSFRDTESEISFVNPIDVDPASRKFLMVPEVTIRFLYDPRLRGRGSKKMTTTLDVNFLIKGTVSGDPEKFGWYHDQLRLSFKCKQRGEVTRVSRENEIVSDHEIRTADSGYTTSNSTIALKGKGREQKWTVGYRPIGGAQFICSSRQENTVGSSENHDLSTRISTVCLKKANFSIQNLEGLSELAYRATFFPSLHLYNVWDKVHRDHLQSSGIMSAVPVKIEGDWEVMRDDDDDMQGSSEAAKVKGTSFCKYGFSCKRELNLLRSQISQRGRVHLSNSPNSQPELSVETVQTLIEKHLQQKLVCGFIINHRFSHMPRLERPDPYVWNMVGGPCPRPADEIVGAESQD